MITTNLSLSTTDESIEKNYQNGLLPQRNQKGLFYQDSSCRSQLSKFELSSENKRILKKTDVFKHKKILLSDFNFTLETQKQIYHWIKLLGWDFPISSVKHIFSNHIFNQLYVWQDENQQTIAYSVCYFSSSISHIAYVFYDPKYSKTNLPIRLSLQVIIDSHQLGLKYCYLGRFSPPIGFYKRNFPGFEYFHDNIWSLYP
jgi:arginyl-tRNA--protein-N-Asp/Glu arginylyltransferase